mmetsp:Transcript_32989/g.90988  ORF Transcript_32989/g.90988 Transcript_32989/m.90988 type:complete len:297 (-) Transcript_32989:116-1006(-)
MQGWRCLRRRARSQPRRWPGAEGCPADRCQWASGGGAKANESVVRVSGLLVDYARDPWVRSGIRGLHGGRRVVPRCLPAAQPRGRHGGRAHVGGRVDGRYRHPRDNRDRLDPRSVPPGDHRRHRTAGGPPQGPPPEGRLPGGLARALRRSRGTRPAVPETLHVVQLHSHRRQRGAHHPQPRGRHPPRAKEAVRRAQGRHGMDVRMDERAGVCAGRHLLLRHQRELPEALVPRDEELRHGHPRRAPRVRARRHRQLCAGQVALVDVRAQCHTHGPDRRRRHLLRNRCKHGRKRQCNK